MEEAVPTNKNHIPASRMKSIFIKNQIFHENNAFVLKKQTSHPDPPDKKVGRVDMDDATPAWAKAMMKKMDGLEGKIDGMAKTAEDAVAIATEAKQQIDVVSKAIVKKEEIQRMIEDTVTKKMHAPRNCRSCSPGETR